MAANDVQIRIHAEDFASSVLKQVARSAEQSRQSMESLGRTAQNFIFNAAGVAAGIAGFNGLTTAINEIFNAVFQFSKSMETNELGMAGILASMTQIEGRNLEWNEALGISKSIMAKLNDEALRTAATSEELVTTFRALLGPGLGAGMNISEIEELTTVGVNAVKSLGLNNAQLVQELRDLVQGGIQPASSTLATALGLKDKDIKAAKESSEGLFKFLMDRLQGFKMAANATSGTFQGRIDQITEGITRIGSEGTKPLFESVKNELGQIASYLLHIETESDGAAISLKSVQINQDLIDKLRVASVKIIEFAHEAKEAAIELWEWSEPIRNGIGPALDIMNQTLIFMKNNIKAVAAAFTTWYAAGKVVSLYKGITEAANTATIANSFLGRAVQAGILSYQSRQKAAQKAAQAEIDAAMKATAVIRGQEAQRLKAIETRSIVEKGAAQAAAQGNLQLSAQLIGLQAEYMRLGVTAEQAGRMQMQAAKAAATGNLVLSEKIIASQKAHLNAAAAAKTAEVAAVGGAGRAASAIKGMASMLFALAGGWVGVAIATGYALTALYDYYNEMDRVKSYDKKADVFYRNGTYMKRTRDYELEKDFAAQGIYLPFNLYHEVELSPEEKKLQYIKDQQEKDRQALLEKYENGSWEKEMNEQVKKNQKEMDELMKGLKTSVLADNSTTKLKKHNRILSESGSLAPLIQYAAESAGISPELLAALVKQESGFKPDVTSKAGAAGLTQLMPETAAGLGVKDIYDPQENLLGGARYLAQQLKTFNGDIRKALAAYNAGPGAVQRYNGIPPYKETQNYVNSIMKMIDGENISSSGFIKKYEDMKKQVQDLFLDLHSKILGETGTSYSLGMLNLDTEIARMTKKMQEAAAAGVDVTALQEEIVSYQAMKSQKIKESWQDSWMELKTASEQTKGQISGDKRLQVQAEYDQSIWNLNKQEKERKKAVMQDKNDHEAELAVEEWFVDQKMLLTQKLLSSERDLQLNNYTEHIEHNNRLLNLEKKSQREVDALNQLELQSKVQYLNSEILKVRNNKDECIRLEKEKHAAIVELNEILSKDMKAAVDISLEELKAQQTDWKGVYIDAFSDIKDSLAENLNGMIDRSVSFGDGLVNIFDNIAKQIRQIWVKMWIEKTMLEPLSKMWGNTIGGISGSKNEAQGYYIGSNGAIWAGATGGKIPAYAVGGKTDGSIKGAGTGTSDSILTYLADQGRYIWTSNGEYIIQKKAVDQFGIHFFDEVNQGRVPKFSTGGSINAKVSDRKMQSGQQVIVNLVNKTGTQAKATASSKFDDLGNMVLQIVVDAIPQNKFGIQDMIASASRR